MSIAEHSARAAHRRQPRRPSSHWSPTGDLHPGVDPASCPDCHPCPTCGGSGEISPNADVLLYNPAALRLEPCPECQETP